MTTKDMRGNDILNPLSMGMPPKESTARGESAGYRGVSSFVDDVPTTMITSVVRQASVVRVRGSVADTSDIRQVEVNGSAAQSTREGLAEWEVAINASEQRPIDLLAFAVDAKGLIETNPQKLRLP